METNSLRDNNKVQPESPPLARGTQVAFFECAAPISGFVVCGDDVKGCFDGSVNVGIDQSEVIHAYVWKDVCILLVRLVG